MKKNNNNSNNYINHLNRKIEKNLIKVTVLKINQENNLNSNLIMKKKKKKITLEKFKDVLKMNQVKHLKT